MNDIVTNYTPNIIEVISSESIIEVDQSNGPSYIEVNEDNTFFDIASSDVSVDVLDNTVQLVVDDATVSLVLEEPQNIIEVIEQVTEILSVGIQGPQGPPGATGTGGTATITYPAGEALGGHRVVRVESGIVYYADNTVLTHRGQVAGLTANAVVLNEDTEVLVTGEIEELSWSWVPGAIYLGPNGTLTQTAPTTGFLQEVGIALTATKMLVRLQEPLKRA